MKILICGSRDWTDPHAIYVVLAGAKALADTLEEPLVLVHGAAKGADSLAADMAERLRITALPFPALWDKHGKAAGPIRNQQMLDENEIAVTYAFRLSGKSNGTDDMVRRSRGAGIPTYVIQQA